MDNFMEKLTHKFSASDMIKANSQADAAELDIKREQIQMFESQMEKVDNALSGLRELNLKNVESAQEVQNLARTSSDKITETVGRVESESVSKIKETSDLSIAGINKTVDESLAKIEKIKESVDSSDTIKASMDALTDKLTNMRAQMEEYLHNDHVKIYRNVQVAFSEELEKRTEEIIKEVKKPGAVMPVAIITLLIALANLAVTVLHMLGFI